MQLPSQEWDVRIYMLNMIFLGPLFCILYSIMNVWIYEFNKECDEYDESIDPSEEGEMDDEKFDDVFLVARGCTEVNHDESTARSDCEEHCG